MTCDLAAAVPSIPLDARAINSSGEISQLGKIVATTKMALKFIGRLVLIVNILF